MSSLFDPGEEIILHTNSAIYSGPYRTRIERADGRRVEVRIPLDNGKLVLLPVGTEVDVRVPSRGEEAGWRARIVDRRGGGERVLVLQHAPGASAPTVPVISIASGKGGVGKSMLAVNLAISLAQMGERVCLIDGDLGTANVDILLNLSPRCTLADVVRGERHMIEILMEGPEGLVVLPGGSGFEELTRLDEEAFLALLEQFAQLEAYADCLVIDTGSGVGRGVTSFLRAASERIILTTPEPHAITDAYALMKVLAKQGGRTDYGLLVNRVSAAAEGEKIGEKMQYAGRRFLGVELNVLGSIAEDPWVARSIRAQEPLVLMQPDAKSAVDIRRLAGRLAGKSVEAKEEGAAGLGGFLRRIRRIWRRHDAAAE